MKTIYRYPLPGDINKVSIPMNAQILCVKMYRSIPHLWALVGHANAKEDRYFEVIGTGWNMDERAKRKYIGTVIQDDIYVWHIFERFELIEDVTEVKAEEVVERFRELPLTNEPCTE